MTQTGSEETLALLMDWVSLLNIPAGDSLISFNHHDQVKN